MSLFNNEIISDKIENIINELREIEVDGEVMEYILEKVGMTDQILRQLILNNPESEVKDLLEEKIQISDNKLEEKTHKS